jgi:hypothetical protein
VGSSDYPIEVIAQAAEQFGPGWGGIVRDVYRAGHIDGQAAGRREEGEIRKEQEANTRITWTQDTHRQDGQAAGKARQGKGGQGRGKGKGQEEERRGEE